MPFTHGKKIKVLVNNANVSEFFKEMSTAFSMDTAETSSFGSEVKTFVQGMSGGTLSLSGMFDGAVGAVDEKLEAAMGAATEATLVISPTGSFAIGERVVAGRGWEGSYQISGSIGDIVAVSAEFTGTGGFRPGVSLHDIATAESATTNSTAQDRGVGGATTTGAIATLNVLANTRDGAVTVRVEHSADNITFATLDTFTSTVANTTTASNLVVAPGVTINRYTRASSTFAGTAGSLTYNVALVRL